ncbi:MAG: ABC transporter substrate-binding protein [Anaerolineales bacterium]
MFKKASILIAMVVILGLVASCGPTATPITTSISTPETIAATNTAIPTVAVTETPGPTTMIIAEPWEPDTFDPIMSSGPNNNAIVWSTILETLAWTDPSGVIHPRLAESWTTSVDGLTWTFTLRSGVKFTTGEPLTADDVVYSFERSKVGGIPMVQQRFANMVSVVAPDDKTVVVTLAKPDSLFINTVADSTGIGSSILSRKEGALNRQAIAPVGTGPLKFVSYSPNNQLVLAVNRDYWNPSELPTWDTLIIRFLTDDASQVAALNSGDVDVIQPVNIATYQSLTGQVGIGKKSYPATTFFIGFSRIGKTRPDELPVAFMKAIDREALAKIVFLGEAVPYSTAHPLLTYSLPIDQLPNYQRDIPGCKALLTKAGYPNGIDLEFMYPTRVPYQDVFFETIQASVAECGIRITLAPLEQAVWLSRFLAANYDISATDQSWYSNPVRYVLPRVGWQAPVSEILPELQPLLDAYTAAPNDGRADAFQKIQMLEAQTGYPFIGTVWVNKSVFWNSNKINDVDISTLVTSDRREFYLSLSFK